MRRLSVLALIASVFGLISCHKYTAPTSTAITCTTSSSTASTTTSISSCTDPATGITIAITPPSVPVIVATPTQFRANVSGGTNNIVTWQVNGIAGGNDMVGRIDASGRYVAPTSIPSATVKVTVVSYEDPKLSVSSTATILAPPLVTISTTCTPTPCTLLSGSANTTTFSSTVTGAPGTLVDWLVNGVQGGNSTFGRISATGVYTAPNTPPIGSIVKVTAASHDLSTSVASLPVTISGYSTSSLRGQFAFSMSGKTTSGGAFFRAGSFSADGNGNLNGGLEDVNAASCGTVNPISFVGTYTISVDGRGTMQFGDNCSPSTFSFVLVNNDQLQITGFDSTGTAAGQANSQDPTFFNASGLTGTYVFDFAGVHGSSPLSQIGEFTADGTGGITNGFVDINDGGIVDGGVVPPVPLTFSGSYSADQSVPNALHSNGRLKATMHLISGDRNFILYIVSRGLAKFVGTDSQAAVGSVAGVSTQQFSISSPAFDARSLNGNIAFLLSGPFPNGTIATAGSFSADGKGNLIGGVLDENVNGTAAQNVVISSGTYAVSSNGRGVATLTTVSHTYSLVFYLSTTGNAVLQEIDSGRTSDGSFVQQLSTVFSLASIQGSYALQTAGTSGVSIQTIAGPVVAVIANSLGAISSGTLDINTAGTTTSAVVTGGYSLPTSNGRAVLTLNPPSPSPDTHTFAVYIVNSTQVFVIGIDTAALARLASGQMFRQF